MNSVKAPRRLWALAALSLVGLGISISLSQHYYALRSGALGFKSFCNISSTVNCDVVALSKYSELVAGLPLASFAGGWFLALFVVSLVAFLADWRRDSLRFVLAMFGFGTTFSILYFYIMASVIKSYCLLCLGVDGVNILGLAVIVSMKSEWFDGQGIDRSKVRMLLGTVAVCVGVVVLALKGMEPEKIDTATANYMAAQVLNSAPVAVSVGDDVPSVGPKDAPITVVEFADFQCPGCRVGATTIGMLLSRYPGKIRLVFHNFPLDSDCNKEVPQKMHPAACEAARVVVCAHRQGKFHEAFEELFDNQSKLAPGKVLEAISVPGLDLDKLKACIASGEAEMVIAKDVEEAKRLGSHSTPTFFINGHKMEGAAPLPVWELILTQLLPK